MNDFDKRLSITGEPMRPGWDELLRSELANILASGHFDKSPTLQKLLVYLVGETIKGGEKLKSYIVAVEGLGKDPQFDLHTDSYPRVQVMRLRKMLEGYYARHSPLQDLCIHIPAGSYEVKLARPTTAYPEIFSRLLSTGNSEAAGNVRTTGPVSFRPQKPPSDEPPEKTAAMLPSSGRGPLLWVVPLFLIVIVVAAYFAGAERVSDKYDPVGATSSDAPLLILDRPTAAANTAAQDLANEAYAKLADGLGRSWAVRLSLADSAATDPTSTPSYRLSTQVGQLRGRQQVIYLRLVDGRNSELIWSASVALDPDKSFADNLGKSVAQIAGPFGIIARRETGKIEGQYRRGYSCLLGYMDYLNARRPEMLAPLSACLNQPVDGDRLNAVRLALLSFHIVATATREDRSSAMVRALGVAQQAIQTDGKEAYAHFAMARIQFVTNNCAKGVLHTGHAAQANPYDPVMLAVLGNFAALCGDPYGDVLLERAFDFRSPGESYARLSLILSAIRNGQTERLPALSTEAENVPGVSASYHHLCETLVAAAMGDVEKARREWRKFDAASVYPGGSPDIMMQEIVLSPQTRSKVISYLKARNVLPIKE
ncbi:MAG: hypothetical protein IBJ12_09900 [Sphingomonadaceae bacterium]|nr:hypothetical protein [Sphingomonadaceae bacterium]